MTENNENNNNNNTNNISLSDIDNDLREIEERLHRPRRLGRAMFESVNSMLGSLRQRLDHLPSASDLSERLRTAEFAHSNRIPLQMLRCSSTLQVRQSARASLLVQRTQFEHAEKHDDEESVPPRTRSYRRSSSLVASRRLSVSIFGGDDMILHEHSSMLLTTYIQEITIEPTESSDDPEMDIDQETIQNDIYTSQVKPEIQPLLPKRSITNLSALQRNISGSIAVPKSEETKGFEFAVYSWGPRASSALHDDMVARSPADSKVSAESRVGRLNGVLSVSCGPCHSAYATNQGEVFACGVNTAGAVDPLHPRDVTEIVRPSKLECLGTAFIRHVSCGWDHTAAITDMGVVLTWGSNEKGQLGHFRSVDQDNGLKEWCSPKAMFLGPGTRAVSVACGNQFTLVLTSRMSVLACGVSTVAGYRVNAKQGDLGLPAEQPALVGLPLAAVAAGKDHAVVLTAHGSAYAWGMNTSGCCGRGYPTELLSPVPVLTPTSQLETPLGKTPFPNWSVSENNSKISLADDVAVVHAAAGNDHTVLVTRSGTLLVCGSNSKGQLGVSGKEIINRVEIVRHPENGRFISAEAGCENTLLLDGSGDVWQMGATTGGELKKVLSGKNILTISAGGDQNVAIAAEKGFQKCSVDFDSALRESPETGVPCSLEELVGRVANEMEVDDNVSPSCRELINRTEQLLKYPSVLNGLFLDPSELDHLFLELTKLNNKELQKSLADVAEKSIQQGLQSLSKSQARMIYPESVRCLLHYIRFFDLNSRHGVDFDPRGSCVMALCETLLGLPYEGFKALLVWMTLYPSDLFVRMLVKPLLSQLGKALHIEIDENGVVHTKVSRRAVPIIVSVLRWLHRASERANIAAPEDFYSEAVEKMPLEVLFDDLRSLKSYGKDPVSRPFLICASPFLIPPTKKRDLLLIESQVNMMKTATESGRVEIRPDGLAIDPFYVLEVERENLLEQTLAKIKEADPKELRMKLRVKFKGEDGVDAGGVTREFFHLLSDELFDVNSSMWTRRFGDNITWFNSDCTWDEQGYELVGILFGLGLYNGVLLDVHFPQAVYRKLLDLPLGLEDLVDPEIRKGMQQLLDYDGDDVEDIFCLSFEVSWMDLGEEKKVELKPGGADIPVTSFNKEEYVLLYVKWLLVDSIQPQWEAFKKGVLRIMESSSLDLFRPEELELLVVGTPELDFEALEKNAEYEGGYTKESDAVQNLWKYLKSADLDTKMKFLQFSTGSSKAPIGGLGSLQFKVQRAGIDSDHLPTSHTCFNTLLLPDYGSNYEKLCDRLGRAILECEGFGLE
ncbi:ubiquitin-protein ligase E3 A [Fistulifera solaris]|uniref:Ubiquitin-protein ligase E3 A n=1 Tax=Fistulifera solaris TaxID=1519565 RepID=A0A1Z5JAZ9_FISSO|nr:ubiquitin-protein ligase E3 A [Fistulifera solaris]|eukprot:GAX11174.1 ubiquitin-protein ligase E3 A [Fistulifera solaris]